MRMVRRGAWLVGLVLPLASLALWTGARSAEPPKRSPSKFAFQVVESFDAKYLGDTPGHIGRGGGLGDIRPNVALGDAVHRGNEKIGTVTRLLWDRSKESLEVEFDPEPPPTVLPNFPVIEPRRIAIGDEIWIALGHPAGGASAVVPAGR